MNPLITSAIIVFFARILQDLVFNFKIEMFNRGNRPGVVVINFFESIIGISIIAAVVQFIDDRPVLLLAFGAGSSLGGLLVIFLREKMNRKLVGQRQYFARISYSGNEDLLDVLGKEGYVFSVDQKTFTDGETRTLIEGAMENRARKERLKQILQGRPNKIVTIIPAREVYWV